MYRLWILCVHLPHRGSSSCIVSENEACSVLVNSVVEQAC